MGNEPEHYNIPKQQIQVVQLLKIVLDKEMIFKDQDLRGSIWIHPQQQIIIQDVILKIKMEENWTIKESDEKLTTERNDLFLVEKKMQLAAMLGIDAPMLSLQPGEYKFPFAFKLPDFIQPSFEYPLPNKRAYLRYQIIAQFQSPYVKAEHNVYFIVKSRPLVLNSPPLLSACVNVHTWGMFTKGTTILNLKLPKNNFKFGDEIPIHVIINNTRGELDVTRIRFKILREIVYHKINGQQDFPIKKFICKKDHNYSVPRKMTQEFDYSLVLEDTEDSKNLNYKYVFEPYPFLRDYNMFMPSINTSILRCEYQVIVTLYFNAFVTKYYRPRIAFPISVTHQLMEDYNLEKKERDDFENAILQSQIQAQIDDENRKNRLQQEEREEQLLGIVEDNNQNIPNNKNYNDLPPVANDYPVVNEPSNNYPVMENNYPSQEIGNNYPSNQDMRNYPSVENNYPANNMYPSVEEANSVNNYGNNNRNNNNNDIYPPPPFVDINQI